MSVTAYTSRWLLDGLGSEPVEDAVVVVEDGKLVGVGSQSNTSLPQGARSVDLGDSTLLPGLVDAHVHLVWDASAVPHQTVVLEDSPERTILRMVRHAREILLRGTTTVRDLGATASLSLPLAEAIRAGDVVGPTVIGAGRAIAMTGGHAWQIAHEVDGPEAVRAAVREEAKRGAKAIKLMASGGVYDAAAGLDQPQLTIDEMRAGVEEAHRVGLRVAAHAYTSGPINAALDAGVDSIEHGSFLDAPTAQRMTSSGAYWVPTAMAAHLIVRNAAALGTPEHMLRKAREVVDGVRESIVVALQAGTRIAAGTDSGGAGISHGTLVEEARILNQCGVDPLDVVRMCTSAGAELCGVSDFTGRIAEGFDADLLAVQGNLATNIGALADVRLVVKGGREIAA